VARDSIRGSFFLFLGMTSNRIILALTSVFVARLLGPKDYGLYTVILVVPSFLIAFSDLGISPAITNFSARLHIEGNDRKVAYLIKTGILFKLIFTTTISICLLFISEGIATHIINRPGLGYLIRITIIYLLGGAILESVNSAFISLDKTEKSSILMNIRAIIKAVASILLIIFGLGVTGAIIGTGLGVLFTAASGAIILLFFTCHELENNSEQSENFNLSQGLKELLYFGAPLYLSALIVGFQVQIRGVMLAFLTSDFSIGNYRTALNLTEIIVLFASPIMRSLFPAFSKLNIKKDRNYIEKMFKLSVKYTSLAIIPVSIAIAILSKNLVYILYGLQYQTAPTYLSFYMITFLCTAIGMYVIEALFNGQGETGTTLKINLLNLAISIPLALILIPLYDVLGLISSILASQLVSTCYGLYQVYRKYQISIEYFSSLKIAVTSLLSVLPLYILLKLEYFSNTIQNIALGGTLYVMSFLLLAPMLGAINNEDIDNFEKFFNELPIIYPVLRYILILERKVIKLNIIPINY